jgi:hypothetical protein
MVKITTENFGKVYMLVPRIKPESCEGCDLRGVGTTICQIHPTECSFNGKVVCGKTLCGIWKEVKDNGKT